MKVVESNKQKGVYIIPECPGCKGIHFINTSGANSGPVWTFNGNLEKPTFRASLLVRSGKYVGSLSTEERERLANDPDYAEFNILCHSFITNGTIEFCNDSSHSLSGKAVELPEVDVDSSFYNAWLNGNY